MDDLDRLYRRLVHNIRANRPEYLQIPFTVRELYEQIIPYRHNRRELAIETNDDYEVSVARLLSGERDYLQGDPKLQESLRRELASPTGDPGVFKDFGDSTVSLTPAAGESRTPVAATAAVGMRTPQGQQPSAAAPAANVSAPAPPAAAAPATSESSALSDTAVVAVAEPSADLSADPSPDSISPASRTQGDTPPNGETAAGSSHQSILATLTHVDIPTGCRFCGGTLPEGRDSNYCPHCGENLRTKRCPACGSEMDTSWTYCVTCGRKAG